MSPDLDRLITLQRLDNQIADARQKIAAHPQRLAEADARLNEAKAHVDTARKRLSDNQEARRALDKEAAVYQGRLSKFKDQQGAVKTNREYQALGHEIETAQHELGGVEEKMIELMVDADGLTADVKQAEASLTTQQKAIDQEKKELAAELARVETSLTEATAARAALIKNLEPRLTTLFENVARVRRGVALSMATRDGLCSLCHVRLRPHVFQQVRTNEQIIQCDSCQRILYYVPPPPPVEHPIVRA
jgi:predicted  nucleic acid-binding Zn-ribbon protein